MILADTSVWADHLRRGNAHLADALHADSIATHEFVLGELTLGFVRPGAPTLRDLELLPRIPTLSHADAVAVVQRLRLDGSGLGWIDVHLLGACMIAGARLWSLDRRLARVAARVGISLPEVR